jgi:hypothetical protein
MKHPLVQYPDEVAKEMVDKFILGETSDLENVKACQPQALTVK